MAGTAHARSNLTQNARPAEEAPEVGTRDGTRMPRRSDVVASRRARAIDPAENTSTTVTLRALSIGEISICEIDR